MRFRHSGRATAWAALLFVLLPAVGCSSSPATTSAPTAAASVAPAPGSAVDAEAFAAAARRPDTVILDVRTPAEFAEGHIEGAVNIDVTDPDFSTALAEHDPALSYAVYCRSGNRSASALQIMQQQGFGKAYHLDGGIRAWTSAGYPVVTGG